jgi:hypothetical protein
MASSNLVLHCGAVKVDREQLKQYKAPPPQGRWFPIAHADVLETVSSLLVQAGYQIRSENFGVTPNGTRFFGTLDLATPLHAGVTLAVGVRNSVDKTLPLGFCAGSRIFVCDNLAFRSELLVAKRHTTFGANRFSEAITGAIQELQSFREVEGARIRRFQNLELTNEQADSLILRAFESELIGHRDLTSVLKEWRTPSFEEFQSRTVWSLLNAFTSALRNRAVKHPSQYAHQTIKLNALLDTAERRPSVSIPLPALAM